MMIALLPVLLHPKLGEPCYESIHAADWVAAGVADHHDGRAMRRGGHSCCWSSCCWSCYPHIGQSMPRERPCCC
ncbi:hypothetical protein PF008_g20114 [Phytophthora fragariae]|uniref:Secreted protein n=1 Tax=Phytophthora fragariae TaxID=53985 RepID=A0A6G0R0F6_9STRA|nr:hypothetical protein PF008_g20114 [Phytophthora fragariae]